MSGASLATKDAVAVSRRARGRLCGHGRPARSADLAAVCGPARLPPVLVRVGSAETLLDDAAQFAQAAGAADVPVTLEIWPA
ncbi:MAG: hypothetical protein K2Z80_30115 [Xanthobacteraceae bacterium]|nr:hypothetical protein [Xanthobacteraceae bacterium]